MSIESIKYGNNMLKTMLCSEVRIDDVVEQCLSSADPMVRFSCINHLGWRPSPAQIDAGLRDSIWMIRLAWSRRPELIPSTQQISEGINDENWMVRLAWVSNHKWKASKEQIMDGLSDPEDEVVAQWVQRAEWTPEAKDIDLGFSSNSESIREAWKLKARRMHDDLMNS